MVQLMLIDELIPNVNLEDCKTEFKGIIKEGKGEGSERLEIGWLKQLASFANTFGGVMYIGVDNKTHTVLALPHEEADKTSLMVQRQIEEHIEPPLNYFIEKIIVPNTSPTRYVIAVHVEKSKYPPVSLRFNGIGVIYVRHFGKTSVASGEEIRNLIMNSDSASFDLLETDKKYHKDDFKFLNDFYKKNNDGKDLKEKDLINIGFIDSFGRLRRGALLFKDDCDDGRTLVECSQFLGVSKGENTFYASKTIKGNLLYELEEMVNFVTSHSADGFVKTNDSKEKYVAFPRRSLIEGIANALGHRNYFIQGGQIEINIYKDRLEIISPGSLIGSKWLNKETNLAKIPPLRRNELICSVFSLCKMMDHKESGFDKIEEEYKPYGEKFSPFASSNDSFFSLTLPDLTHVNGLVSKATNPPVHTLELLDCKNALKILSFCYNENKTASDIANYLKIKPSSYFRKEMLLPLVEKGYLLTIRGEYPATYRANSSKVIPD
ncbi:MAG TPA: hypothetical protein DCR94_03640 [Firmicutes bacterium]|nr:hypothetical protein [Bacillota bacterium]